MLNSDISLVCILKVRIERSECDIPALWSLLHVPAMFRCRVGWNGRVHMFYATLPQEVRGLYKGQFYHLIYTNAYTHERYKLLLVSFIDYLWVCSSPCSATLTTNFRAQWFIGGVTF